MKKIRILFFTLVFILLFGLISESKAAKWIDEYFFERDWDYCTNEEHDDELDSEDECKIYKFKNYYDDKVYKIHVNMRQGTNLREFNKQENIPTIKTNGVLCMQHDNELYNDVATGNELQYLVYIYGNNVEIDGDHGTFYGTGIQNAPQIAYILTRYDHNVQLELGRLTDDEIKNQVNINTRLTVQKLFWYYIPGFSEAVKEKNKDINIIASNKAYKLADTEKNNNLKASAEGYANFIKNYTAPQILEQGHDVFDKGTHYKIGPIRVKFDTTIAGDEIFCDLTGENTLININGIINNWFLADVNDNRITRPISEQQFYIWVPKESGNDVKLTLGYKYFYADAEFLTKINNASTQAQAFYLSGRRFYVDASMYIHLGPYYSIIEKVDEENGKLLDNVQLSLTKMGKEILGAFQVRKIEENRESKGISTTITFNSDNKTTTSKYVDYNREPIVAAIINFAKENKINVDDKNIYDEKIVIEEGEYTYADDETKQLLRKYIVNDRDGNVNIDTTYERMRDSLGKNEFLDIRKENRRNDSGDTEKLIIVRANDRKEYTINQYNEIILKGEKGTFNKTRTINKGLNDRITLREGYAYRIIIPNKLIGKITIRENSDNVALADRAYYKCVNKQVQIWGLKDGTYEVKELSNNNYGYNATEQKTGTLIVRDPFQGSVQIKNRKDVGNLKIIKSDKDTGNRMR